MSHPTWVRGLKQRVTHIVITLESVAPYVGAWIETVGTLPSIVIIAGRTLRGCVD